MKFCGVATVDDDVVFWVSENI